MKRHLNLIPLATQRRQTRRKVAFVWTTSVALAGVFAGLLLGVEWLRGMSAMRELQNLQARYAPFDKIAQQHDDLVQQISHLRAREQLTLRLSRDEFGISMLGALAVATRDAGSTVYVNDLKYHVEAGNDAPRSVRLSGAGVDSGAIAGFAQRLRETGVFRSVAVESTGALPGGAVSLRQFSVACRL